MKRLLNNKAAGVDGMVGEFLTQAYTTTRTQANNTERHYILGPAITRAFNAVLLGSYPHDMWGVSALVPVPKPKGRPDVKDDHRGIAVGSVLAKLYAITIMSRLDTWAESAGARAHGQAGFRATRGTPDNAFILRHIIDTATSKNKPVYCAFIDFSKAYDRVDRALLWQCLEGLGIHGEALNTLKQMSEEVWLRVRAQGKLSTAFRSTVGVKQGCPLSPLLFGLMIDRLEAFLQQRCPHAGAHVAGLVIRALLYADDVVLIAESAADLQHMLDALHEFCTANCMMVNESKSAVVVFNSKHHRGGDVVFMYDGRTLPTKASYVYLGMTFTDGEPIKKQLSLMVTKARKVMYALFGRCYKLLLHNLDAQGHAFDTLVQPILCYGCEIWGPDWITSHCDEGVFCSGEAELKIHRPFMRQSLGVNSSTQAAVMMQELNREPFMMFWVRMAAQLWNKAVGRREGDYLRAAMIANVRLLSELGSRTKTKIWAHHFTSCMESLGITWQEGNNLKVIDVVTLHKIMRARWDRYAWKAMQDGSEGATWLGAECSVRAAPSSFSNGFKAFVYKRWFANNTWRKKESYVRLLTHRDQIEAVAQLRTGSHWLLINRGRFTKVAGKYVKINRADRRCPHCKDWVDDEMHLLECPSLLDLRMLYGMECIEPGQATDADMRRLFNPMNVDGWQDLGKFLVACKKRQTGA